MRVSRVKISNYRNIGGVSVWLNDECSYIVGGNNIGKTNFLSLLGTVCEKKGFEKSDFFDASRPIEVELELSMAGQNTPLTRRIYCQRPDEARFEITAGGGRISFIEIESAAAAGRHRGELGTGGDDAELRLLQTGAVHTAMASVNLLSKIMELYGDENEPFEQRLHVNAAGLRLLPLVLAVDEPEVHLHPYMQRSLINHYQKLLRNEDAEFVFLLHRLFGLDGIDGQLVVVTHSTDALVGDFRNLIRFYRDGAKTAVVSGANPGLRFTEANEKHMIMRFPEIKEAFYANCALLIEGETEYGCIADFAREIRVPLDDLGICIINARGEGSIRPLRQLLAAFAVPSIAIYDGDTLMGRAPGAHEFYTHELCFEIEIVSTLLRHKSAHIARQIVREMDAQAEHRYMSADFVRKQFTKMGVSMKGYSAKRLIDVSERDEQEFLHMYSAWLMAKKGVLLGRIIGEALPGELIPDCYKEAIRKARDVATKSQLTHMGMRQS